MGILTRPLLRAIRKPQFFQTVPIIIELEEGINPQALANNVQQTLGIETRQVLPMSNAFSIIAPTELVNELAGIRYVRQIHLDRQMYAFQGPFFGTLNDKIKALMDNPQIMLTPNEGWIGTAEANKATGVYELHKRGIKGQGVKVWVLDTGVDVTNPQLQGVVAGAYSTTLGTPADGCGHGAWCCSRITGQFYTHPIFGIEMLGAAPECELHSVKVLTDLGFGNTSDIMKGMEMALNSGADVVSMSLGGEGDIEGEETDPMVTLINKAAQTHPKTVFVIAAGNSGSEGETAGSTIGIPANAEQALSVGAWSLIDNGRAYYSSTGPTLQAKRSKPDICGIGGGRAMESGYPKGMGDIYSGSSFGSQLDPLDKLVDGFCPLKGTSMATPDVASGCVALWKQLVPQLSTKDIKGIYAKYGSSRSNTIGHGLYNATWILEALGQAGA
jgi:subtilisin family serine protease